MNKVKLMKGNNLELLKKLPDNSIDSVVTDPPYGLSFMNKKWDYDVPSVEFWQEVYRVLKPGGHVLSFGGTRTYHRMVINMEDAGFEIRDQIMWIYGSGFPKSLNVGKAVDKLNGNEREVVGEKTGGAYSKGTENLGINRTSLIGEGDGRKTPPKRGEDFGKITKGSSEYEGWGTALKPANEPICLARKPLSEKSVAENVLKWKTGGINVDGCRVATNHEDLKGMLRKKGTTLSFYSIVAEKGEYTPPEPNDLGRFPANIILECCCDEVVKGEKGEPRISSRKGGSPIFGSDLSVDYQGRWPNDKGDIHTNPECPCYIMDEQSVSASRFFYQAKVSKKERNLGLDGFEVEILSSTMKLLLKTDYNNKNLLWEKQDLKTKLVDTDKSHQKDIEEFGVQKNEDKKWNIELFGKVFTDQFLMDIKSIILTATNSITIYQTLNSLIQKNIKTNIQELSGLMVKDIKLVNDVENKNIKMSFTLQKKDGYYQNVNLVELNEVWTLSVKENKCSHPTLKPVNLLTYLCRMITPPNGIILDPFMGSGSTGIAAQLEGFRFCGMEMDEDYFKIAEARITNWEQYKKIIK